MSVPPKSFERNPSGFMLQFSGINTMLPVEKMPPGKYPYAQNVRAYLGEATTGRAPLTGLIYGSPGGLVHSIARLNDSTPAGPPTTHFAVVVIGGAAAHVFFDATVVSPGFVLSGNRVTWVPFRPNLSVQPWLYMGDSFQMVKFSSTGAAWRVGIAEPQVAPTTISIIGGALTGTYQWRFRWRSSIGALSNPSPASAPVTLTAQEIIISTGASSDPQMATGGLVDVYRLGGSLLNWTYVGTVANGSGFADNLTDLTVVNNPILEFDNYEPFPSIDLPASGVVSYNSGTQVMTYTSGNQFNVRWLPGTLVTLNNGTNGITATLYNRPSSSTTAQLLPPPGVTIATGTYNYQITTPILAAQQLPALWGPTDNVAYMFGVGDPLRPGVLYWTKGNNFDSAPDTNQQDVTSPTEPLMNGCIVGGIGMLFSNQRAWLIYPNFFQALATASGVQGNAWTLVESISNRGLYARNGVCTDGGGTVYFISNDGVYVSPGGTGSRSITDDDLYNIFPHEKPEVQSAITIAGFTIHPPDFTQPQWMLLSFCNGYLYFDYLDVGSNWRTLVYDPKTGGWCPDVYTPTVLTHASDFSSNAFDVFSNLSAVYVGCTDNSVRMLSATGTETETSVLMLPAFNAGDERADKKFGDIYINAQVANGFPVTLSVYTNLYQVNQTGNFNPATLVFGTGTRTPYVIDLATAGIVGEGIIAPDLGTIFSWTSTPGNVLYTWQPTLIPQPETTVQRFTDWDDGGSPQAKFVQGVKITADSLGNSKFVAIQNGDDNSTHTLLESPAVWAGQSTKVFSCVPFVAHSMRLRVNFDAVPWKVWDVEYVFVPYPEAAENWTTEPMSHGSVGWQHLRQMNIAYITTPGNTVSLVLTPDFGSPQTIPLADTGGVISKLVVTPNFNKFKLMTYSATSAAPFRLFVKDIEVKIKQWGSGGAYQVIKPFGDLSQEAARI